MKSLLVLTIFSFAVAADQDFDYSKIVCDYEFMGIRTTSVEIIVHPDGSLSPSALINMQGKTHKETLTPEAKAPGEYVHAWISKESPDNSIEMVIYEAMRTEGQSKLTNHHVPIGQDMWGRCSGIPGT